jgi:hypothetical protein
MSLSDMRCASVLLLDKVPDWIPNGEESSADVTRAYDIMHYCAKKKTTNLVFRLASFRMGQDKF